MTFLHQEKACSLGNAYKKSWVKTFEKNGMYPSTIMKEHNSYFFAFDETYKYYKRIIFFYFSLKQNAFINVIYTTEKFMRRLPCDGKGRHVDNHQENCLNVSQHHS